MKKILNKKELIKEIIEMKRGTVYTLTILDKENEFVWCTLITKVRWFDSHVVIIGGSDDELIVSKNFSCEDEDITDKIEELVLGYGDYFTLRDKSKLIIQSDTPSLGFREVDNFQYVRKGTI